MICSCRETEDFSTSTCQVMEASSATLNLLQDRNASKGSHQGNRFSMLIWISRLEFLTIGPKQVSQLANGFGYFLYRGTAESHDQALRGWPSQVTS